MTDPFDPQPPSPRALASICRCPGGHTGAEHARRESESAYANQRASEDRHAKEVAQLKAELDRQRTSTTNYTIERVERVGTHLVMQVRYPNCEHRAFEGLKTMVFLNVSELAALRWKSIDPHFRGPSATQQAMAKGHAMLMDQWSKDLTEAPSPAARFPGDESGWSDAVAYARGKA